MGHPVGEIGNLMVHWIHYALCSVLGMGYQDNIMHGYKNSLGYLDSKVY